MWGWKGVTLVVSLVLGVLAGLAAAAVNPADDDPLHLGIPRVDQPCTGHSLLVLGQGDTRAALRRSIVNSADGSRARYLDVAESCPTMYAASEDHPVDAAYVVYLGPFDTASAACEARMSADHLDDPVTRLAYGNRIYVKCPCELATSSMPTLQPGLTPDAVEATWIRQLQGMLSDVGLRSANAKRTGRYDAGTQAQVRRLQAAYGQPRDAVMDQTMWEHLTQRACKRYDY